MTELTRRHLLAGAAAIAANPLFASLPAFAAAPPAGTQAPGFYRYKVGSIEITVVTDGVNRLPVTDEFVTNVKKEEVQAGLVAAYMDKNIFFNPYNPIVINTGSKLALVDTGTGEAAYKASKGTSGQFLTNLQASGIDRAAIDTVIISHFHGDHINGLRNKAGAIAFPNAGIFVPQPEWAWWMDAARMAAAPE